MKTRMVLTLGLSGLVLGGTMVGCTATNQGGIASAGTRDSAVADKLAAQDATLAGKALAKGNAVQAVAKAESAVALMPRNAEYRALLGQGYLKAGRFASARAALTDALALSPQDGRTALNLALAEIAVGDWQAARTTLAAHAAIIPAGDRGLALALAGDPASGVAMLTEVAKSGEASPKVRQNLALALALAGQWQAARVVASADMSPADVDSRMEQWAAFTRPTTASDQVATLLGVRKAPDAGQPVALALTAPVSLGQDVVQAETLVAPAPAAGPLATAEAALAAIPPKPATSADVALAAKALAPMPVARPNETKALPVRVTARPAVNGRVAASPTPLLRADPRAIKVAVARPAVAPALLSASAKGGWYVQIGAYHNAAVARDGWRKATRRMPRLAAHTPMNARFAAKSGAFYRLAFGGFARGEADAVCRRYRAIGGACFVRVAAGDQVAQWAAKVKPVQLASR